ncbi:MAG: S-methyl-5-thioribose-1-phosphate isomerase [Pseudomonadales bacterium]|nr:S-methyl-5-thioribose-1-phosphate isomerase [Pseudomonadales bacterium]MCP5184290.1 S-methyl-5-thioribose-1-phosphate isomerase [Pseudomonadales bacterium]
MKLPPPTILWEHGRLSVLDQRLLPHEVSYRELPTIADAVDAIRTLTVRGAPAIGIAAGYALAQAVSRARPEKRERVLTDASEALKASRPTAVNLAAAINRLLALDSTAPSDLIAEAVALHTEDRAMCAAIGRHGAHLVRRASHVLTHCNAGALAVSELGTATAPMYTAHGDGHRFHVWVDETRPLLQGARLTAWELSVAGIDVTLICDNMAASLMAAGRVDLVIVGTDRVARNGDTANKIGTLGLAVLARHFQVPFYVACPATTYDAATPDGRSIPIELRDEAEVRGDRAAAVRAFNPAFDVTPVSLITGFITNHGLLENPDEASLLRHFAN